MIKPTVKIPIQNKEHLFPILAIVYGIILVIFAVLRYFNQLELPALIIDLLLLVGGLWLIWLGVQKGLIAKHQKLFKKYI